MNPQSMLPAEYEEELARLRRQQQMSQALYSQALQPRGTEMAGRVAIRRSPLEFLAQGLQAYLSQKGMSEADKSIAGVKTRAQEDYAKEFSGLQADPDQKTAIARALVSKFPQIQAWGASEQKRRAELVKSIADATKDVAPGESVRMLQGGDPSAQVNIPKPEAPRFINAPDGRSVIVNTNRKGEQTGTYAPRDVNVTQSLGGLEKRELIQDQREELKTRRTAAKEALASLATAGRAVDLLEQGAKAGGGQSVFQAARKFAQAFGLDVPETGMTDALRSSLGNAVLEAAQKVRPVSNTDIPFVMQQVGSIDTDPGALARLLAWTQASSLKAIQDYGGYVDEAKKNSSYPELYAGQQIGIQGPKQLAGPLWFQLLVLQELQRSGGDISGYRVNGEPIGGLQMTTPMGGIVPPNQTPPPAAPLPNRFKRVQ